jgi:hypothetical protein
MLIPILLVGCIVGLLDGLLEGVVVGLGVFFDDFDLLFPIEP